MNLEDKELLDPQVFLVLREQLETEVLMVELGLQEHLACLVRKDLRVALEVTAHQVPLAQLVPLVRLEIEEHLVFLGLLVLSALEALQVPKEKEVTPDPRARKVRLVLLACPVQLALQDQEENEAKKALSEKKDNLAWLEGLETKVLPALLAQWALRVLQVSLALLGRLVPWAPQGREENEERVDLKVSSDPQECSESLVLLACKGLLERMERLVPRDLKDIKA